MKLKALFLSLSIFAAAQISAQNVYLSKIEKTVESSDRQFVLVNPENTAAEFLGLIEVQGFSKDDALMFSKIYQKAKEIGANAFAFQPFETVDEKPQPFNASNYRINLYSVSKEEITKPEQSIILVSSSAKPQTISVNRKNYTLQPRSFTKLTTVAGEIYTISTKKLLGSTIKASGRADSPAQYFQVSAAKIKANTAGEPGINLKSGDIIALERSYGDFLRMIYTPNQN